MFLALNQTFISIWHSSQDIKLSHIVLYDLKNGNKTRISGEWLSADTDQKQNNESQPTDYSLICGNFSENGKHLAICDNKKQLIVFEENENQWKQLFKSKVDRNCIKIIFAKNKNSIICCHKSGDVFEYEFENNNYEQSVSGRLLLGHCSMLLDFMLTSNSKYLITCDRDEKIRVSRYPNSYHIESFCLGHKEFVSSLAPIDENTIVSGSGDGSVRMWNIKDGKQLKCLMCDTNETLENNDTKETQFPVMKVVTNLNEQNDSTLLAIAFFNQSVVKILSIESQSLKPIHTLVLDEEPVDILFDSNRNNILWVLLSKKENPLNVFEIGEEIIKSDIYKTVIDELNASENFVEQCVNAKKSKELEGLYKHWFNNVEIYLQKKSQRQEVIAKKKKFQRFE